MCEPILRKGAHLCFSQFARASACEARAWEARILLHNEHSQRRQAMHKAVRLDGFEQLT